MPDIDWSTEWSTSLLWVVGVTLAAAVGSALIGWALGRWTAWGRQLMRLAGPHFSPRGPNKWWPALTALGVLTMAIVDVRLQVINSYVVNGLYTALQQYDGAAFLTYVWIFVVLSVIGLAEALLAFYLQQRLVITWRVGLNDLVLRDWLDGRAYQRGRYTDEPVDNPDQRIQEDVASATSESVSLAVGAISSVVSLESFTIILWQLSGPLPVFGVEVPRAMTFAAYLYVIIASVIAFRIGRPLIRLNFEREQRNASFRYALVRVRDNAESIAFQQGETAERGVLLGRFGAVIGNAWAIVFRSLRFQGFNLVITQFSQIIPLLIQAPRFFARQITLGDIQQTATAFGQVHDSLSFFRNAYDDFAGYRAVLDRLTGLLDVDANARALPVVSVEAADGLEVDDLTVRLPDGPALVDALDLRLAAGETLLVTGRSGSGKTTLLRSLAGLWPYAQGAVRRPGDAVFFQSQQPYLPLGTLRTALAYPASVVDDARASAVLQRVQLPQLVDRLDDDVDWAQRLSPGEQQRLGFARILLARPRVVFLDESTSAVDEGLEHFLYAALREDLPDAIVVSVGHRGTLEQFHSRELQLDGTGGWTTT